MKKNRALFCLTIFLIPFLAESNDLHRLKQDFIVKIEQNQIKYGEENCCAIENDVVTVFSQFNQNSKNFVSLSTYQKIAHECRLIETVPDNIRIPDFKRDQIDFIIVFDCIDDHIPGYKHDYVLQLLIRNQREENTLDLIGICEHQEDSGDACKYNYFKQIYPEYDQAHCPFYKSNKAYALYQSYLTYKKDNSYSEFHGVEKNLWIQALKDTFEKFSDSKHSQDQQQKEFDKAVKSAEKKLKELRVTDEKYQQQLISDHALLLAQQYENRYFVSMDLVKDIEADLKHIRQKLVASGNTYVPHAGVNREDVRTVRVESPINERLDFKSGKEKLFEHAVPEEIDCINQFWGFNQLTIHAVKNSWDTNEEPWKFHMTLAGEISSRGMHYLEYIEHGYFENYRDYYLFQNTDACNVNEYPKLALAKLGNGDQLYVYSSGGGDCPSGCIEKYYTNFHSSPYEGKANPANNTEVPECNYDENIYLDYFNY